MPLFPILANPGNFDGLNVSIAEGKISAVNVSDNAYFEMNASRLSANSATATWAELVDLARNPTVISTPSLKQVLNVNYIADANASIRFTGGADELVTTSLTNNELVITESPNIATMNASSVMFDGSTVSTTLSVEGFTMSANGEGNETTLNNSTGLVINTDVVQMSLFNGTLTSNQNVSLVASNDVILEALEDIVLKAGNSSIVLKSDNIIKGIDQDNNWGNSDQFLSLMVGADEYRISLLSIKPSA
jgi:hypothetical protein